MVTRTQGEADANRIRQNSLTPQLLDLRRIENSRALIDKWNGQLPTVESGQGSGMMLQLPSVARNLLALSQQPAYAIAIPSEARDLLSRNTIVMSRGSGRRD